MMENDTAKKLITAPKLITMNLSLKRSFCISICFLVSSRYTLVELSLHSRAFKTNCTYTFLLTRDISLFPNDFQITSKMLHRVNAKIVTINRYMGRYVQLTSQGEGKYNEQHKATTLSVHFAACKTYSD